jgi:TIR domain
MMRGFVMDYYEEEERFVGITSFTTKQGEIFIVNESAIKTEEDFEGLIHQMYEYAERNYYYYKEVAPGSGGLMLEKARLGYILMEDREPHYYRHTYYNLYVHIEPHDGQYNEDWEREVVEKGPEFLQYRLRLTERARRELEIWYRLRLEEELRRKWKEAELRYDVFISYSSADSSEANQLFEAVKRAGGRAFLSAKSLKPGGDFAEDIRESLIAARQLWLLVSPTSLKSDWVLSEWGAAWALEKKIVPILHRCSPEQLPDRLSRLHCIDFYRFPELIAQTFPVKPAEERRS